MIDPLAVLVALAPAAALGWLAWTALVGLAAPREELGLKLLASPALGFALLGAIEHVALRLTDRHLIGVELAVMLALALAIARWPRRLAPAPDDSAPRPLRLAAGAAVAVGLALAAYAIGRVFIQLPLGAWDAWDFWNMRADLLVSLGEDWRDAYSPALVWAHPRYPPLHSATVARAWATLDARPEAAPMTIAACYALGALAVVAWGLTRLRGVTFGALAAAGLLGVPQLVLLSGSQYADVPLAFLLAATTASLALFGREGRRRWLVAAGLFASLAALTKNEGLLFVLSTAAGVAVVSLRRRPRASEVGAWLAGAAPGLALLAWFRASCAPPGMSEDYLSLGDPRLVAHVSERAAWADNWRELAEGAGRLLWIFDGAFVPLVIVLPVLAAAGRWSARLAPRALGGAAIGLLLHLSAVCLSFVLLSTWSVADHVESLDRLLLQLVPAAMFLVFAGVWTRPTEPRGAT